MPHLLIARATSSLGVFVTSAQDRPHTARTGRAAALAAEVAPALGERPWERLDPALVSALIPELAAMADEIIREIAQAIPAYRRPLEGPFGRELRVGVQEALRQFLQVLGRPGNQTLVAREVYAGLGRGELRAGRGLDALQAAYRVGARVAWRRVSAAARAAGADAATVSLLAESIFAYIDEISAESVEGYAQAQAAEAGEQQRRRQRLVRLMVADSGSDAQLVQSAAAEAAWMLPRRLAALVVPGQDAQRLVGRLGGGAIGADVADVVCVLVPDAQAPGRQAQLARVLGDAPGALGPSVGAAEALLSYTRARQGLRLQQAGVLPRGGLILVEEHLGTLVLHRDPELVDALARRRLAPLLGVAVRSRERLAATLAAWLRHQGNVPAVAGELHVHRQTVRYRMARVRELFGAELDNPQARFEIDMALRAAQGRAGAQMKGPPVGGGGVADGPGPQVGNP